MAMTETHTLHPRWPKLSGMDPDQLMFDFDRDGDTLYLHFYGEVRPSISVPLDDHYLALVDPVSEGVVGIQIEGFLVDVAHELPAVLELADVIGLRPAEIQQLRARLTPEHRKRALLEFMLGRIKRSTPPAA